MHPTTEVRWFFAGDVPGSTQDWLQHIAGPTLCQESRVDHYLRLPDHDGLGMKLREHRVEIKMRESAHGLVELGSEVIGRVESWRKWSFELAGTGDDPAMVSGVDASWVGVGKQRSLQRYCISEGGVAKPVFSGDPVPEACALELVQISVLGQSWWSLAFEAHSHATKSIDNLLLTARQLLNSPHPFKFRVSDSYSYPHWLSQRFSSRE